MSPSRKKFPPCGRRRISGKEAAVRIPRKPCAFSNALGREMLLSRATSFQRSGERNQGEEPRMGENRASEDKRKGLRRNRPSPKPIGPPLRPPILPVWSGH